ncbi:MAG: phage tail length tape measure family protein [Rhodobacteraceae bacterium]|nr:phage tail length tape measure family protein [Paracoccaceae bacterium]
MTEAVHSLQLKIDAAAAEAGSKRFTAALSAVKKAVSDLDRAADGTFAKLANHKPQFDVAPLTRATTEANRLSTALAGTGSASDRAAATIQRTALASASAVRMAEQATQRLALRMGDLGDTQGVASLNSALAQMKVSLVNATSTLDVRRAKSQFDDLRSGLLQATVAAEYAQGEQAQLARELEQTGRAAQQQAEALSRLRAAHDPLFAASQRYATALSEIDSLVAANMVSEAQASAMRERAAATYLAMGSAADTFAGQARNGAMAAQQVGFQLNDIGVMLAGGMSPLSIAVTQGTQLAQTFQGLKGSTSILSTLAGGFAAMFSPVSLVTIGVIALGAAIVQWMTSGSDATKDFATALADADSAISSMRQATDTLAGATLGSLAEGYGRVNAELQTHLEKLQEISRIEATRATADAFTAVGSEYLGGWLTTDVDDMRIAFETTNDQARVLLRMLDQIKAARTFEEQFAAVQKMRTEVESVTGGLKNAEGGALAFLMQLIKAEDAGIRLKAATDGTAGAADNASGAASGLAYTIGTAADEAARLLMNLNSVPGALAVMGKSVEGQIASIRAQNRALSLELSEGLSSAAANRRVQLETMVTTANERGQRITPDAIAAEWMKINELDAAAKETEQLRNQITERNRPARSAGGGGGGRRTAALTEEQKATEELNTTLTERLTSLEQERLALELVASGQFQTAEAAQLFAEAMTAGGGAVDAQTAAMIAQIDAAAKLNEELKKLATDPVKDWMDSVPNWIEAGKQIEMGAINSLRDSIADMIKTGKLDFESLGEAILGVFADVVSDKAVKELLTLFGRGETGSGGWLGGLFGDLFASQGDSDVAGMVNGGTQAGAVIGNSMIQAGQVVSQQLAAAMAQGGMQAGASAQSGLAAGSVNVRTAAQTGLAVGSANIHTAATSSAPVLAQGVVSGAQQGAPILGQGVAMGAAGGGGASCPASAESAVF